MGNYYSLYSKNLGLSGKMVWWSTEPNWSTKLGDLTECLKLTLHLATLKLSNFRNYQILRKSDVGQRIHSYKQGSYK